MLIAVAVQGTRECTQKLSDCSAPEGVGSLRGGVSGLADFVSSRFDHLEASCPDAKGREQAANLRRDEVGQQCTGLGRYARRGFSIAAHPPPVSMEHIKVWVQQGHLTAGTLGPGKEVVQHSSRARARVRKGDRSALIVGHLAFSRLGIG